MKNNLVLVFVFSFLSLYLHAQEKKSNFNIGDKEIGLAVYNAGLAPSFSQMLDLGKKKKLQLGIGLRATASFGNNNIEFITAPAHLTSKEMYIDTLSPGATFIMPLNLYGTIRYNFTPRWSAEFNIDFVGFSFGTSKPGAVLQYKDGNKSITNASPSFFNLLLIGDRDYGSLNSEIAIAYRYNPRLRFRAGASFLFNELSIDPVYKYIADDGTVLETERYRNKRFLLMLGFHYLLKHE